MNADVNSKTYCSLREFRSDDFALESRVGSIGILSISSYKPSASGFDSDSLKVNDLRVEQLGSQEAKEDNITATLWKGRIARGELGGTRVILKAYPARTEGMDGFTADTLAANELATHAALQPPSVPQECPQLAKLLGGFVSGLGGTVTEQWLVFRNDGLASAESYCAKATQASADGRAVGEGEFWDRFDASRPIRRRKIFILKCIREMLTGLAFMHSRNRLHQSLGPSSLILSTTEERDAYGLRCRLRDLAFAVDVSDEALMGGATLSEIWERGSVQSNADPKQSVAEALWQRARGEGAWSGPEKRAFGIADDVYAAGLLLAYMCLVPLSEPARSMAQASRGSSRRRTSWVKGSTGLAVGPVLSLAREWSGIMADLCLARLTVQTCAAGSALATARMRQGPVLLVWCPKEHSPLLW
eukprot:CAMPEP_0177620438 /NCGR_PEP_ID=MMETSP0419_2-20121207/26903_1 /TAXON_ID=582737 /ORGANISM="Tetraselmis sp., Strain GSL018" /LENGTH=416 /DNA_ID=CAMNT_0019119991 /DNA_START=173 /DNA_END=1421 /DNA_ORIENTATION=-